jgi:hypothetical protein
MADDVRRRPRPASRRSVRPHLPRRRARHSHNKPPGRRKPSRVQRQPQRCRDGGRRNRKLRQHPPLQLGMVPRRLETPDHRFRHPHKPSPQRRNRLARNGHRVWPSTARHRRHHAQAPCARRCPPTRSSNNSRNDGRRSRRRPNLGRRKLQHGRSRLRRKLGHNPRRNPQFSRRHLRFHRPKMAARQMARTTLILRW